MSCKYRKAQKKKELERRLKERKDKKGTLLDQIKNDTNKSPEKQLAIEHKVDTTPVDANGETVTDEQGRILLQEPDYSAIRLTQDQQIEIYDKIEALWPQFATDDGAESIDKDAASDLLKQVAEQKNINEAVFEQVMQDHDSGK